MTGSRALAAALAAGCLALAGCGDDTSSAQEDVGVGGNAPLRLADCDDWNGSGVEERLSTIEQLTEFAGGPVGQVDARGAILDDDQAYDVLDGQCEAEFAGAFKLYKLYTRAAAFIGH